jgi:hypothetical protein
VDGKETLEDEEDDEKQKDSFVWSSKKKKQTMHMGTMPFFKLKCPTIHANVEKSQWRHWQRRNFLE